MTVPRQAHGARAPVAVYEEVSLEIGRTMSLRPAKPLSLLFALAALLFALFPVQPATAGYPDRIIKIVVPFAPGGGTDVIARTLAQEMAKDLGATIVIENKPGAGTIIGTQSVATSEPDGYTLLMGTFANAVNPSLNSKLPYEVHCRPDLGRESRTRQIVLWDVWHRHLGASGGRAVQEHGQDQSDDGTL
jgi:hypothetical protein